MNTSAQTLNERKGGRRTHHLPVGVCLAREQKKFTGVGGNTSEKSPSLSELNKYGALKGEMIGASPAMRSIHSLIKRVGRTSISLLITGESGTGKELAARAVHNSAGHGRSGPFVAVNCGAMPEGLIESELFGHERGAFTGASAQKKGKAELADGGTLFLDEIATMPLHLQVKLLRFLQERTFTRVGGNALIRVNLRVIAAANINLYDAVLRGVFREDLYYRLNVVPLKVPSLRERSEDIALLAEHFMAKYSSKYTMAPKAISSEALCALSAYDWPGNVRELENIMERLVVLALDDSPVKTSDLPEEILSNLPVKPLKDRAMPINNFKEAVRSFERTYITSILEKTGWNRACTARLMKVHRNTLLMKMKALEIRSSS